MKKYSSLGELLVDYRKQYNVSQSELAAALDVDVRSVQRWERDITLVNPVKEKQLVEVTLLPPQLIRNLNSLHPIPVYFDFDIRKYSFTELTNELPDVKWIREKIDVIDEGLKETVFPDDMVMIERYINERYSGKNLIKRQVVEQGAKLLPQLNQTLKDHSGCYVGHMVVLPLKYDSYKKIRDKSITNSELTINDLQDFRTSELPVFYAYSITADSNDRVFGIITAIMRFFKWEIKKKYIFASFTHRYDSEISNPETGLKKIWSEESIIDEKIYEIKLYEGDFTEFLDKIK
jgi:transcriptional regulator with XRE-family HTH domain